MRYDFTTVYDRRGKDSLAADGPGTSPGYAPGACGPGFTPIPMWIADMNFATFPGLVEALTRRSSYPIYGYFAPGDAYFDAILRWQKERNGVEDLCREDIGYENSVLGGVVSCLKAVTQPGDGVLVHEPVYAGFLKCLKANDRLPVLSPLIPDHGLMTMDYADMEEKIRKHRLKVVILCNPHNPTGRAWTREELRRAMTLFRKYDLTVIADEIWSDLMLPGFHHVPVASVSEDARHRTASFYAPSKTFNLAGLIAAYHIIYSPELRQRVEEIGKATYYNRLNVLSMHALQGAYCKEGGDWVDQLRQQLRDNMQKMQSYLETVPGLRFPHPQATYMLFVDVKEYLRVHSLTLEELEDRLWSCGVMVQDGRQFHGMTHLRMNLALPPKQLEKAIRRMKKYVFTDEKG